MLMVFAVLAISMSLAGAVDVRKTVEGPTLLDFGERLKVTVTIDTGTESVRLGGLTDPIPDGFTADITGSSCSQSASYDVTCNFGSAVVNGTYVMSYSLVAVKPVEEVHIKKAILQYSQLDSSLSLQKSSNQIGDFYTVGPPMVNLTRVVSVDGTAVGRLDVLPNSKIKVEFRLHNTGAMDAENVSLSTIAPDGWSVSKASTGGAFILASGDSKLISVELSGPPMDKFSSGMTSGISAIVRWSGGNRTYSPVETRIPLKQIRPDITASRLAGVKWKLAGKTLEPSFFSSIELRNVGTAKATVMVVQDAPAGTSGVKFDPTGSWSSLELEAGHTKKLLMSGPVGKDVSMLAVPAAAISYTDAKGNAYQNVQLNAQAGLKVTKGVAEMIFDATSSLYPWLQLLAAVLIFVSGWAIKNRGRGDEGGYLTLAFAAIGIVALLIVVSTLKVIMF